jgi:hypothetical protein
MAAWLREKGASEFAFWVITHPHLDHLRGSAELLSQFEGKVGYLWRWPGLDERTYQASDVVYFNKLRRQFPTSEMNERATALSLLFAEHERQCFREGLGRPVMLPFPAPPFRIYPFGAPACRPEVFCLSPWDGQIDRFRRIVNEGRRPGGTLSDNHRECNLVSGAFLVRYGKADVVLTGDTEYENWRDFRAAKGMPRIRPCLVKVSHHGSPTGRVKGMWGTNGSLGRHKPHTVVTPWNKRLPDPAVIADIRSSGCPVYLTGQDPPFVEEGFPHIHFRVEASGHVEVKHQSPSVHRVP